MNWENKMRSAGIIVTYNRKELLKKSINCLINQTLKLDKIFIIDNASNDGTKEYIKKDIEGKNIEYIFLEKNLGGSEGFYQGIKCAYDQGYDYIWGMDDDAFADAKAFENLMKIKAEIKDECCLWSNCNNDIEFEGKYKKVQSWMFVGFFITKEIIKKVGFPRRDFFIYHDDSEYGSRIIKSGFSIVKVKDSIIKHGDFSERPMFKKKILGKELLFPEMPDWKFYYYVRNSILMYPKGSKERRKQMYIILPKMYLKLKILNTNQNLIFKKAYSDGKNEVLGKSEIF